MSNRLQQVSRQVGSGAAAPTVNLFDLSGNLVSDGVRYYRYDCWNRLMQVRERGTLTFDSSGVRASGTGVRFIVQYSYDALGRTIRELPCFASAVAW